MAGFFGLFNYEKEGPGISKNAPKKKTFIVFFETYFRNFWKFVIINIVYGILSLPLITGGLASVGITNVNRNIARDKHSFGLSDFFDTIKKNWKQGLIAGIINTIVYILLLFDVYFFITMKSKMSTIFVGVAFCLLLIFTMMNYFIWTLMITFKFSIKQIYKNSFKFAFINLKGNFICFFSLMLIYASFIALIFLLKKFWLYVILIGLLIFVLFFPCFKYLLIQFCVFPSIKKYIIDPYYRDHPDEDIEKRRDLGIEIEEDDAEDEEEQLQESEGTTEEDDEDDDGVIFTD